LAPAAKNAILLVKHGKGAGMTVQELLAADALIVGNPEELVERKPGAVQEVIEWPKSPEPRGLTLKKLTISRGWDKVLWMFDAENEIFYTSVAFDMSGNDPFLLPPKPFDPEASLFKMTKGETIEFKLGEGEPVFPERVLHGGISLFIMVWESDDKTRRLGETLNKMHEDLTAEGSVMERIKSLILNPGKKITDEILSIGTAALQPLATLLKQNGNEFLAPFRGYYKAQGSWASKLSASHNGVSIELGELA